MSNNRLAARFTFGIFKGRFGCISQIKLQKSKSRKWNKSLLELCLGLVQAAGAASTCLAYYINNWYIIAWAVYELWTIIGSFKRESENIGAYGDIFSL